MDELIRLELMDSLSGDEMYLDAYWFLNIEGKQIDSSYLVQCDASTTLQTTQKHGVS